MTVDFFLKASSDQSEIPNVRNLTKYTNLQCPVYNDCSVDGFASTPEEAAARTAANGSGSETLSCKAAPSRSTTARDVGLASVLGALGLALMRAVRRKRVTG